MRRAGRVVVLGSLAVLVGCTHALPDPDSPGARLYQARCATCHGGDGNGAEMGPPIRGRLAARNDQQLTALIKVGLRRLEMQHVALAFREKTNGRRTIKRPQRVWCE